MLSIVAGVKEYIEAMVDQVPGMKILILDADTMGIISLVLSQSSLLKHDVFLVERIDVEQHEQIPHTNAVCLLRPTKENFGLLSKQLKEPKFKEYHIFFTNVVPQSWLEQLAYSDESQAVQQVQEFYADVFAIGHDLFSLNLPSTIRLTDSVWTTYDESVFNRIIEGLLSACLALRMLPIIRYTESSQLTQRIAARLQKRLYEEQSIFETIEREQKREPRPVLLLTDRREDPVTPMLNQWTYQAMVHELLSMESNCIDMSKVPNISPELKKVDMSTTQDAFLERNQFAHFRDLLVTIPKYVADYQSRTCTPESIEEMQQYLEQYPAFKQMTGNVSKHVAVVHELNRIVETNGIPAASALEQQLACFDNRHEHLRSVLDMLKGQSITTNQKLRLAMLYALRYEHPSSIQQLKGTLRSDGISEDRIGVIDQYLRYASAHVRSGDLFNNKSLLTRVTRNIALTFNEVEDVYTMHRTHVAGVADNLLKGQLSEVSYPFFEAQRSQKVTKEQVLGAIVFVVGGTTFEESRDIAELNKRSREGTRIILGGTTIHNSRSFLADVAQLNMRGVGCPE